MVYTLSKMRSVSPGRRARIYPIRWQTDVFLQRDWFNFAKLRLFLMESVRHKMEEFGRFEQIAKKNDIFRRPDWTKNSRAFMKSQLNF